jgi:O-antigen ligase
MSVIHSVARAQAYASDHAEVSLEATRSFAVPKLNKGLLIEFLLCMAPLPPTFLVGIPKVGGYAFVLLLMLFLMYHSLRKEPYSVFCLIVGAGPLIALLRGTFMPFDTPVAILAISLAWAHLTSGEFKSLWKRKDLLYLIAACGVYWLISFLRTHDYANNLRALELGFCAAIVFILNDRRSYLATALVGIGISTITMGLMLAPYGDRLGMGYVPGMDWSIGNPILIGIPAALFILLALAEGGRWLLLENHPFWRVILGGGCTACLLFSTSRGSWLLAIIGMIILAICDPQSRKVVGGSVAILVLTICALANTAAFSSVIHYFNNVASSDTTLEKKTTGRIDQWRALPAILEDSPFFGVGPGSGRDASREYANKGIIFHSLYLQVGAELGFFGLFLLAGLLIHLVARSIAHYKLYHEVVPMLGLAAFMLMGMSVSAIDMSGGLLIGLAFIAGSSSNMWLVRYQGGGRIVTLHEAVDTQQYPAPAAPEYN